MKRRRTMRAWLLNEGNQTFARLGQEARTKLLSVAYCTIYNHTRNCRGRDTESGCTSRWLQIVTSPEGLYLIYGMATAYVFDSGIIKAQPYELSNDRCPTA